MKRIFYTLSLLLFSLPLLLAQVPKKILIEETTQASCPPCATYNPAFDALMQANTDNVVVMKYQVWWPGYDPMYEENTPDVDARVGYLIPNAAPNIYINGGNFESITSINQARIDAMATQMSPISINIEHELNDAEGTVDVTVTLKNESSDDFPANTYRLITVLQEDEIHFNAPPGTNGEREFLWVMRKMLPSADGTPITEGMAAGESLTYTFSQPLPWYTKDLEYIGVTAWVENPQTREVVQAEHSEHKALNGTYPDLAFSYALSGYDGYCDTEADAVFEFRNDGSEEITSFDISAVNPDGSLTYIDSWSGSLAPGAEDSYTLSGLVLNGGANALRAVATNIDGKPDKNGHNNLFDNTIYYVLQPDPFAEEISEGFNVPTFGVLPPNMILDNPAGVRLFTVTQDVSTAVNWPLGGHGLSEGCMRFDFPSGWPNGARASMVFEKIDLTNSENTSLEFTYAYSARGGLMNDRVLVEVSTDCAETWDVVFDEFGWNLVTGADPGSSNRFYPMANEWADTEVDMSQFDGAGEVIIRFTGIGGGSQAFYLDDINVMSNPNTGTTDEELAASFRTYPNPASDIVNINFTLTESQDVNVTVFDVNGKVVETLAQNQSMNAGENTMTWEPNQTGVYTIQIESNEGQATQRVSVFK